MIERRQLIHIFPEVFFKAVTLLSQLLTLTLGLPDTD